MLSFRVFALTLAATLSSFVSSAAIVETANGDRISCTLISLDSDVVKVRSEMFGELEIKRKNISKIDFDKQPTFERTDATRSLAKVFESMPSDIAASMIKAMWDAEYLDLAVRVLRQMEPRNVAKCLAEINDPEVIAELAERFQAVR